MASPARSTSTCPLFSISVTRSYETYPQIPKEKSDDITRSNYYGGGVMDEHFIVWMRLAGVPHFRKLYGRLEGRTFKKGDTLTFHIQSNFELSSFKGRKGIVIATDNFIGGKNVGMCVTFGVATLLCVAMVVAIQIVKRVCPEWVFVCLVIARALPVNGGKYD